MNRIKVLKLKSFSTNEISVCCLRKLDIMPIRDWRNSQIKYLRQTKNNNKLEQVKYFKKVVIKDILNKIQGRYFFSILNKKMCIGYGGLVHIDWKIKIQKYLFFLKPELYGNENSYTGFFMIF